MTVHIYRVTLQPGEVDEYFVNLRGRLARPEGALRAIGAYLVARSDEAFDLQEFGGIKWPERYADGPEPYVNVAGLVADFASGRNEPKERRFDRRPALMDTGDLRQSIAAEVIGDKAVEVGSSIPYAAQHQEGGTSIQRLTRDIKGRLYWEWLKFQPKPMKRRLGWLLNKTIWELETHVHARPFVGVTKDMHDDLVEIALDYIAEP